MLDFFKFYDLLCTLQRVEITSLVEILLNCYYFSGKKPKYGYKPKPKYEEPKHDWEEPKPTEDWKDDTMDHGDDWEDDTEKNWEE